MNGEVDDYGPIFIPKKGVTIDINTNNLPYYRRVIGVYEKNKLEVLEIKFEGCSIRKFQIANV